jgi:hypothetical protein
VIWGVHSSRGVDPVPASRAAATASSSICW